MAIFDLPIGSVLADVFTSPHAEASLDPEPALVKAIKSAKHSIYFAAYAFTLKSVADAIIDAHARGVTVRGVLDSTQYGGINSRGPSLHAAGVDVRTWGTRYTLMHDKVAVIDGSTVVLGSFNWTTSAEKGNVEVMLIAHGVQVSRVLAPTLTTQVSNIYDKGHDIA